VISFLSNNNDLLDSWAMPDDLAKQVSEALSRKSITPEQELQDALDEMARDIALIEPDPQDWAGWVMYFVDRLEEEAKRRRWGFDFNILLDNLVEKLLDRTSNKRWSDAIKP
jgi:hypothetical protein